MGKKNKQVIMSVEEYEGKGKKANKKAEHKDDTGKPTTPHKERQAGVGTDAYGYRLDSNRAKFNAMMSKDKPVPMNGPGGVVETLGCKTMYNHINAMIRQGYAEVVKGGYVLTGKLPEKKEEKPEAKADEKKAEKKEHKAEKAEAK